MTVFNLVMCHQGLLPSLENLCITGLIRILSSFFILAFTFGYVPPPLSIAPLFLAMMKAKDLGQ